VILALIDEAEHFFLDNVREVADRPLEELRLFDHRHADFFVPVTGEDLSRDALHVLPGRDMRGNTSWHAAQGLDNLAQERTPISCWGARYAWASRTPSSCGSRGAGRRRRRPRSAPASPAINCGRSQPPGC